MRAVAIRQPGPADVLQITERPVPAFKTGELLIKVHAAGINRPGRAAAPGQVRAASRRVRLAGPGSGGRNRRWRFCQHRIQEGRPARARWCRVAAMPNTAPRPPGQCLPLPKGLTALEGASLPETSTVWSNVFDRCALADGETLLVQGGTSGIGVTAIQLAAALGHRACHGGQRREGARLRGAGRRTGH